MAILSRVLLVAAVAQLRRVLLHSRISAVGFFLRKVAVDLGMVWHLLQPCSYTSKRSSGSSVSGCSQASYFSLIASISAVSRVLTRVRVTSVATDRSVLCRKERIQYWL